MKNDKRKDAERKKGKIAAYFLTFKNLCAFAPLR